MLKICQENREEIEREFLALILNKWEVIDLLQIKPKALHNIENQKMLRYKECIHIFQMQFLKKILVFNSKDFAKL